MGRDVRTRPAIDDPAVVQVLVDDRLVGEVSPFCGRWQIVRPWGPATWETQDEAIAALVEGTA